MNNEYIKLKTGSEYGQLAINNDVIVSIVKIAIEETKDIELVNYRVVGQNIVSKIIDNKLHLDIAIKVKSTSNVAKTCEELQNNITKVIKQMTNLTCEKINIIVDGFIF
ncbi:MAG: Asp23/Gls24 family envelope stress response protein [Erysipelotrichaceae bacterium]